VLIFDSAKLAFQNYVRRNWYASQPLKLLEFAESDRTPLDILISIDVFVGRLVHKNPYGVLVAEPHQFRQRRLNGLRVLQRDDDICVY
jgi:hypothetical protein